jgi:sugar/nucleoside kinase (ribokinase family)
MSTPAFDLVCVGGSAVDLVLKVPYLPAGDDKLVASFAGRKTGGLVGNTACAAARLGLSTAWMGLLGGDAEGQIQLQDFHHFGVDTSLAEIIPGSASDFTVILLDPAGERTILVVPVLPNPFPLNPSMKTALEGARVAYTLPYSLDWFLEVTEIVHRGGGMVAVDIEASCPLQGKELEQALSSADLVFCTRGGLAAACGTSDLDQGAASLLSLGIKVLVVTLGALGAAAWNGTFAARAPAFAVPAVDTTGAGDCFHAAFLVRMLKGGELESCLRFASAAAALSIQRVGARGGLPTRQEVETFLQERQVR